VCRGCRDVKGETPNALSSSNFILHPRTLLLVGYWHATSCALGNGVREDFLEIILLLNLGTLLRCSIIIIIIPVGRNESLIKAT
jgi:hypothetical protein